MKIPMNIKAVIFDMDGLMIDSEPYWRKADEIFFKKYNKPYKNEINTHIMGKGQREIVEYYKNELGFVGDTNTFIDERRNLLYEFLLANISPMEGVEDIVHSLYKKGLRLAIATSGHTREKTGEILQRLGLETHFTVIVSGDDVYKGKPAPDIYLKTAEFLKIAPEYCLVLEDAPNGILSAKAARMVAYGVNIHNEIYTKLKEAAADKVFRSL